MVYSGGVLARELLRASLILASLVPASLVFDRPWTLHPSMVSLGAATVLGVACTGVALLIYFRLVRTLGSMGVTSQSYLRAGWSVLLGALFLGEAMTVQIGIGLAAIVLAVSAMNAGRGHNPGDRDEKKRD